jgi:ATP-dependent Clp protease ATP-binding subunit ClpA
MTKDVRFSVAARLTISRAQQLALSGNCTKVETGHLFLALISEEMQSDEKVSSLLQISGVALEEARMYAQSTIQTEGKGEGEGYAAQLDSGARNILDMADEEARRLGSPEIENEHLLIACLRTQRTPHVGEVLRPLGLDAAKLRQHLRELAKSQRLDRSGGPLNSLTQSSKTAVEAAHAAMRASYCGRISTAHLLLGILDDPENVATETLLAAKIDIEELRKAAQASITSDGQIATPQKKFSAAAKRALDRAKKEADRCAHSFIGPQHLLFALLPRPASAKEKIAYGDIGADPLEKVWSQMPVAEIERQYQILWKNGKTHRPPPPTQLPAHSRSIKTDWRWLLAGVGWWLWMVPVFFAPHIWFFPLEIPVLILLGGFGFAVFAAIAGETKRDYLMRDNYSSFVYGVLTLPVVLLVISMILPIF